MLICIGIMEVATHVLGKRIENEKNIQNGYFWAFYMQTVWATEYNLDCI